MKSHSKRILHGTLLYLLVAFILFIVYLLIEYLGVFQVGIAFSIVIVAAFVLFRKVFPKSFKMENLEFINTISNVIFAFFIFMTFYLSYQTYDLTYRNSLPRLNIQLRSYDVAWGEFGEESDYYLPPNELNKTYIKLPVFLTVNNYGQVPNQVYNVHFETNCGKGTSGLLSIPKNASTLIKPGEFFEMYDDIWIKINGSINLPCEVKFKIHNTYFEPMEKRIIMKNPRT